MDGSWRTSSQQVREPEADATGNAAFVCWQAAGWAARAAAAAAGVVAAAPNAFLDWGGAVIARKAGQVLLSTLCAAFAILLPWHLQV